MLRREELSHLVERQTDESEESSSTPGLIWRTMLHVGTLPSRFGDALNELMRYAHQSVTIFFCPM